MAADLTNTNELVSLNAAVDISSSSTSATTRLETATIASTVLLNEPVINEGAFHTNSIVTTAANVYTKNVAGTTASADSKPTTNVGVTQPINYKFNLPPHNWSLPVRPMDMDEVYVGQDTTSSFHGLRRGRIWYWVGANNTTADPTTTTNDGNSSSSAPLNLIDTEWGFQFLWNPTTISTGVARNMDITPSSADTLRVVAGVFPGQETVSLNIVIDRTNDFACIKAPQILPDGFAGILAQAAILRYYNNGLYPNGSTSQNMTEQITNLMNQGTMADLEYLFKAINGSGNGDVEWTNLLGKKTANVGYLAPTLLGIQLGPTLDNLSYVGWVSNISLTHTAFTETMIPIRTEVGLSIQCFAGSGLTSGV